MLNKIEEVNNELDRLGISDFHIESFKGDSLVIWGSFDMSYYHEVELVFEGVRYINCPVQLDSPVFRLASENESAAVASKYGNINLEGGTRIVFIDDEKEKGQFFIAAGNVESRFMKVMHYVNEDVLSE